MRINDIVQLLDNRLREFKLSRDYARMNGDLARMNVADEEISNLEDTLFQLNLLVDTSKSAAVKEAILAEVITDGSVAVLDEYDITSYATDPLHEEKIMNILSKMGVMDTVEKIDDYITSKTLSSPVTGEMIMNATEAYTVDARLMMAIMELDSRFGTVGVAVRTFNPGNVGNDDSGNTRTYESWQEGVTAVAEWLSRHRGSTIISENPLETIIEPVATSTPIIITSTTTTSTTTTPMVDTSTPTTATSTTTTVTT
ncbi:MAG: glucosaminidase domain-containing protein, partial [Parcubacteria group bacterium]|nr:glucosaminidase domain-containing protein [Parcubacteria group bacterium]